MQIDAIIAAARACLGTPFVPQGRDAKYGLDCAGLILHAFGAAGIALDAPADYPFPPPGALVVETLEKLGFRRIAYTLTPALSQREREFHQARCDSLSPRERVRVRECLVRSEAEDFPIKPGSLLLFRFGGSPQHLALATAPDRMLHAFAPAGMVIETSIGPAWLPRLSDSYQPPLST